MKTGWQDTFNAQLYETYALTYPLYRESGKHLLSLVGICPGQTVLDLACGTGTVTVQIQEALQGCGIIIGVDISAAMLAIAKEKLPLATFSQSPAERLAEIVPANSVDLIVCNSAFWQMDIRSVLAAIRTVLKPAGRFAFNHGTGVRIIQHGKTPSEPLLELMRRIAREEYGLTFAQRSKRKHSLTHTPPQEIHALLTEAGLPVVQYKTVEIDYTAEGVREFLKLPIINASYLPGSDYEIGKEIVEKAYQRATKPFQVIGIWDYYITQKK
ncbi:class I SAM-dependent methyltransferase [Ktedonosporobacter rubrisoli]|uniref:Class I SAM-dependent methyltransferase n=1 Tax=Ktedonosporobacter rubrisoli TaxID=2509675 RepID=A0A4P6JM23_KTERU|nr:class I SAM-dependent methyltransferase [Ktedonosporobacter rubrisoli]QBD75716.1 class I SAM-dependent methyltransferase [Ktedonosporobacter rubrisoli]